MSYQKILHSPELIQLYQQGHLFKVLLKFADHINQEKYLGAGTHAASFRYKKGREVLKICTKKISYFQHFPLLEHSRDTHAQQFQKQIDICYPYLLPVKNILYEDNYVFIYTQKLCHRLSISKITREMVAKIFRMVHFLTERNLLLTDLAPNNFGLRGKRKHHRIFLYDYHDLQPISVDGKQPRTNWWKGIIKNLTLYMSAIYCRQNIKKYEKIMENFNQEGYQIIKKERLLPPPYIKLLYYVSSHPQNVNEERFCQLLEKCVENFR